jgi:hypothetical protein
MFCAKLNFTKSKKLQEKPKLFFFCQIFPFFYTCFRGKINIKSPRKMFFFSTLAFVTLAALVERLFSLEVRAPELWLQAEMAAGTLSWLHYRNNQ